MIINHNIAALNTHRQLGSASGAQMKSMEKLASGLRINKAGDDAAGLAISEKMRGQIRGLDQAARNSQDGVSMLQTAEGALNETHAMLQRMRELTVQANNGTNNSDDLDYIQKEISELSTEITETAKRTEFNTKKLLTGNLGVKTTGGDVAGIEAQGISIDVSAAKSGASFTISQAAGEITLTDGDGNAQTIAVADESDVSGTLNFDALGVKLSGDNMDFTHADVDSKDIGTTGNATIFQIGANSSQSLSIQLNDMQATAIGTTSGKMVSDVDVTDSSQSFTDRLQIIDDAIKQVSEERSKIGAFQNRLEHTINNLNTSSENLTAAESRIRDVDYALAA